MFCLALGRSPEQGAAGRRRDCADEPVPQMLTALDLFAGAGGFSLGFIAAGWQVVSAIELDPWAAETYTKNLGTHLIHADISSVTNHEFSQFSGIDAILAGPPCQGFSISAGNRRAENDNRNFLFRHFIRAVRIARPQFFAFENVPAILGATSIREELRRALSDAGYSTAERLVDAADFGVPQRRQRYILLGWRATGRGVTLRATHASPEQTLPGTRPWITVAEAISDLPTVRPRTLPETAVVPYENSPTNEYQREMRSNCTAVANHIPMRHTDRLIERFRHIPIGGNEADAWHTHAPRARGKSHNIGQLYDQNHRRMSPNAPAPTITASFYSSFVHPTAPRNLTVREAARLQSFPDTFCFYGKRTTLSKSLLRRKGLTDDLYLDQFNQVGNAVPPLLAAAIATALRSAKHEERHAVNS